MGAFDGYWYPGNPCYSIKSEQKKPQTYKIEEPVYRKPIKSIWQCLYEEFKESSEKLNGKRRNH